MLVLKQTNSIICVFYLISYSTMLASISQLSHCIFVALIIFVILEICTNSYDCFYLLLRCLHSLCVDGILRNSYDDKIPMQLLCMLMGHWIFRFLPLMSSTMIDIFHNLGFLRLNSLVKNIFCSFFNLIVMLFCTFSQFLCMSL